MTSPYVTFPHPTPTAGRPAAWRVALTTVMALVGPPMAGFFAFWATVTWTGCFIDCNDATDHPNPLGGGLLYGIAVALLLSGPLLAGFLLRSAKAVALTLAVPVLLVLYFTVA
ncbi:MAG: hypothetical protein QOI82_1748 [Actinomycetota bacterium]|jgi:hypothetical protein|nr:hypothetical protein [Actinomycetota bacterium]